MRRLPLVLSASSLRCCTPSSPVMSKDSLFQNIRVYCTSSFPPHTLTYAHSTITGLAFIVYWGIILFGYDT